MREYGGAGGNGLRTQFLLAAACLLAGLFLYLIPAGPQQNIASGIRLTLLRPFVDIRSALSAARSMSREADMLRAQVDSLRAWVANNAPAIEENRRLRVLIGLAPLVERSYRAVSVHRPGNLGSQSTVVLDLGHEQGVHGLSPIITADGLAGRVLEAHPSLSIGMDWSHPDFRASVMSEDGELYGIVGPEPAAFGGAERLILTGIPYFNVLEDGTLMVTSGRGGVYPRGVPVGRIGGLAEVEEGWHRSYWVYPTVHPASVTHALVGVADTAGPGEEVDLSSLFPRATSPLPDSAREAGPRGAPGADGRG